MSDQTGDDVPRDPWGNPLGPEDRAPAHPQPDDFPPPFPSDPPGGAASPSPWGGTHAPPEPPSAPPGNPAWPGSQPSSTPSPPTAGMPGQPGQPGPGWGGPGVPPQLPYQPPGAAHQGWGQGTPWAPPRNDGMAIGALVCAIVGLLCLGIVLEPVAIALGVISRKRIRESNGALRGDGMAIAGIVIGVVGLLLAIVSMVLLIRDPDMLDNLFSGLTTTTTTGG